MKLTTTIATETDHSNVHISFLLRFLLHYLHAMLHRQQTRYVIYIVEQETGNKFNRAVLMNAGFLHASTQPSLKIECMIFHDVDLISEDDRLLYRCPGLVADK